jgi:hypothetical protein
MTTQQLPSAFGMCSRGAVWGRTHLIRLNVSGDHGLVAAELRTRSTLGLSYFPSMQHISTLLGGATRMPDRAPTALWPSSASSTAHASNQQVRRHGDSICAHCAGTRLYASYVDRKTLLLTADSRGQHMCKPSVNVACATCRASKTTHQMTHRPAANWCHQWLRMLLRRPGLMVAPRLQAPTSSAAHSGTGTW